MSLCAEARKQRFFCVFLFDRMLSPIKMLKPLLAHKKHRHRPLFPLIKEVYAYWMKLKIELLLVGLLYCGLGVAICEFLRDVSPCLCTAIGNTLGGS